jgi:FixJ family two-component response regulator
MIVAEVFLLNPNKIAVIDDDPGVRDSTQMLLQSLGYGTATFASAEEFLHSPDIQDVGCIISDVRMPGMSGPELHRALISKSLPTPVIFITAYIDHSLKERALASGAFGFLGKPVVEESLLACIESALQSKRPKN